MSLSATNLTLHTLADVNTDLWQNWQAGTPYHNTAGADGFIMSVWEDAAHGGYAFINNQAPTYKVNTPLMALPCLEFLTNAYQVLYDTTGVTVQPASVVLGAGAKTIHAVIYPEAVTTNFTGGNVYLNDQVMAASDGYWGIALRDHGSATADANGDSSRYKILAWNDTGPGATTVELSISLNTSYLVTVRHDGTSMYLALNGGTPVSFLTGNTGGMTGELRVGRGYGTSGYYNGRLGEMAFYNASLTGGALSGNESFLMTKWGIGGGGVALSINVAD